MNLSDIQSLVLHAFRGLPHASYVLVRFSNQPAASRAWLAGFVEGRAIDDAVRKDAGPFGSPDVRLNIALTYTGLERLDVEAGTLATFPLEFVEGLGRPWPAEDEPDHRSRMLGDVGESRPSAWSWGFQDQQRRVDAMLLAFARDPVLLEVQVASWIADGEKIGALEKGSARVEIGRFPEDPATQNREHFGFVDGISQPVLTGAARELRPSGHRRQPATQEIDDGEVVLGYRDGARQIAHGPSVAAALDPDDMLPPTPTDPGRHDLGIDGTYLVFRKLSQNVDGFTAACARAAAELATTPEHAAALIVGRWRDGSPLMRAPIAPDARFADAPAANDFTYAVDPHGERCPMGAHIRRANPRDALGDDPAASLQVANRHRILRRGRPYHAGGRAHDADDRGLHFICLNASIARQFEFVQQNWINDPTFGGLDREDDPLLGARTGAASAGRYTTLPAPGDRLPRRVSGFDRFVTVKGGAYFFLPSINALRFLSRKKPLGRRPAPVPLDRPPTSKADRIRALLLARFSLLSALLIAAAPLAAWDPIAGPNFELDRAWEMVVVAAMASLAAAGAMLGFRVLHLYARVRFDVNVSSQPIGWTTVWAWQAVSLPIVVVAGLRSVAGASLEGESRLWLAAKFAAAAAIGYAVSFAVAYLATAARGAGVRPDNPAGAILLPLSARLDRLTRNQSLVERAAKPVVDFVESRAALLSESAGVGYVDHRTGRLLPGHLTIVTLLATLAVFYVAGWFVLRPPAPVQLPPLAYFLFLTLMGSLTTAAASFWLDRYRFPLLTAILAWLVVVTIFGGTDHEYVAYAAASQTPAAVASAVERADVRSGNASGPIVVVAAAGGGIRQAMWTARVLTGLTELFGRRFTERLRMVSGVSAGGLGALHFVNEYSVASPPETGLDGVVEAAGRAASGDIWWGLAYPDAIRGVLAFPPPRLVPRTMDRGWALQESWRGRFNFAPDAPRLSTWRADVANGWRPAMAFNATIVETGERAVFATYDAPTRVAPRVAAVVDRDLPLLTAARLSAAFPYVSPVARPSDAPSDQMFHIADGGYWDNSGVVSALEWLHALRGTVGNRPVLVVQIAPPAPAVPPGADRAWVWQFQAPLSALLAVRGNAQDARNRMEVETFRDAWPNRNLAFVTIADQDDGASIGWHLSRREKCAVESRWRELSAATSEPIARIASILGPPEAAPAAALPDCAR